MELVAIGLLTLVWVLVKEKAIRDERDAWVRERRELLNRIKPETAVPVVPENARVFEAVPITDDGEWWKAREERGLNA